MSAEDTHASNPACNSYFESLYSELKRLAQQKLSSEFQSGSLFATDLIHEVYLRLGSWEIEGKSLSRGEFYRAAATCMRRILVDRARARKAIRRGGDATVEYLPMGLDDLPSRSEFDWLRFDELLDDLKKRDSLLVEIIEMKFVIGLTWEEISESTGQSVSTLKRDWRYARAWLQQHFS